MVWLQITYELYKLLILKPSRQADDCVAKLAVFNDTLHVPVGSMNN